MSEAPDPLEAELSALRPREVSPGMWRHVAERLADAACHALAAIEDGTDEQSLVRPRKHATPNPRRLWWLAFAGGLSAACLAAIFLWWASRRIEPEPIVWPQPTPPVVAEDPVHTLLAYQRALAQSPEELDAMFDRDAMASLEANPEPVRIRPFTWSAAE